MSKYGSTFFLDFWSAPVNYILLKALGMHYLHYADGFYFIENAYLLFIIQYYMVFKLMESNK